MTYNIVNQVILIKEDKFSIVQCPNNFFGKEKMLDILYASTIESVRYIHGCICSNIVYDAKIVQRYKHEVLGY